MRNNQNTMIRFQDQRKKKIVRIGINLMSNDNVHFGWWGNKSLHVSKTKQKPIVEKRFTPTKNVDANNNKTKNKRNVK